MFQRMKFAALERRLTRAYKDRLAALGAVPKGVFWRNQSTQIARFDAMLSIVRKISPVAHPAVADIGCGYGALLEFIQKNPALPDDALQRLRHKCRDDQRMHRSIC
jgi:hypothetical protein